MFFALMVFLCGGLGAMARFFVDKAMSPRLLWVADYAGV